MSDHNFSNLGASIGLSVGAAVLVSQAERRRANRADRLEEARDEYYDSLRKLEWAAEDQALKEEAFVCGIVYASLMRDAGREREFSEETVVQEILRAIRLGQKQLEGGRVNAVGRLQQLEDARQAGLITDEEYRSKRAEILASM